MPSPDPEAELAAAFAADLKRQCDAGNALLREHGAPAYVVNVPIDPRGMQAALDAIVLTLVERCGANCDHWKICISARANAKQ